MVAEKDNSIFQQAKGAQFAHSLLNMIPLQFRQYRHCGQTGWKMHVVVFGEAFIPNNITF